MFKKSLSSTGASLFTGMSQVVGLKKGSYLDDAKSWHNVFFSGITSRIDESPYAVLYPSKTGRRNAPIRQLVAMMVLKEGENWTDKQLFEQSRFNLLVLLALGLRNLTDEPPVASTYYEFKKKVRTHYEATGEDLLEQTFSNLAKDQVLRYEVSGQRVRMDSKLIASNIANCTRLQLVISVLQQFYKSLAKDMPPKDISSTTSWLSSSDLKILKALCSKACDAHTYPLTTVEKRSELERLGLLIHRLLQTSPDKASPSYQLLHRLFSEQYHFKPVDDQEDKGQHDKSDNDGASEGVSSIELRDKKNLAGNTLQSAHDADATFRRKESGQKEQFIKGYSSNITENCTPGELNLILAAQIENAGYSDDQYFQQALNQSEQVLGSLPDEVATDGAYNSTKNLHFIQQKDKPIQWHLTAIQGTPSNFDYQWNEQGQLLVTDKRTGQTQIAKKAKTRATTKNKAPRYRIKEPNGTYRYIEHKAVLTYFRRQQIKNLPKEIKNIRPNVEATIHQVFFHLNGQQSKYRGIIAHRHMVFTRCIWVNYRRISDKINQKGRWKLFFRTFTTIIHSPANQCAYNLKPFNFFRKINSYFNTPYFIPLCQGTFFILSFRSRLFVTKVIILSKINKNSIKCLV